MKINMSIEEALEFADTWAKGCTFHEGSQGWRVVCLLLAEEVRKLRKGEFICTSCSLRKNSEWTTEHEF
jgi:hypothetical protein